MNPDRYSSLIELQQAHDDLSRTQASKGRAMPDPDRVADFVRRAVATGAVLDGREERSVAQSLTNFWAKRLTVSNRAAGATDAPPLPPTTDSTLATSTLTAPSPPKPASVSGTETTDYLRPSDSATWPVTLLPPNGSSTTCPGCVKKRMKKSGNSGGKRAGWIASPAARQRNRYSS